jgi:2,4-dienoyl-CoA reductase-like NADH-dependent reductase (Old Yellow Enzyme family)
MTMLFEPIKVRELEVRNRIFMAPMCQYSCENKDGAPSNWHLVHYGARATGGAGLIIMEATAVLPEGRITPWCTGIWNDHQVAEWKKVNDFVHTQGAKTALQLAHAGRKASTYRSWSGSGSIAIEDGGWQTVSSGTDAFDNFAAPRELQTSELGPLVQAWAEAAKRAVRAGFDAIEIHAAHGYLIHQFLSPITNHRTDEYGGPLENRARLLMEIVISMRAAIGEEVPIFIRFSATDYREDGWNETETAIVAKWAADAGADLFDISSGALVTGVQIPFNQPGYQVKLAEFVAERVEEPVSAVGNIFDGPQAEAILQNGQVEVISIGRPFLRDPYWALRAASELGVELDYWQPQDVRGKFPKAD